MTPKKLAAYCDGRPTHQEPDDVLDCEENREEPLQRDQLGTVARLYLGHALEHDDHHAEDDGHEQRDVERFARGRVRLEDDLVESMSPVLQRAISGMDPFYFSAVPRDFMSRGPESWPG